MSLVATCATLDAEALYSAATLRSTSRCTRIATPPTSTPIEDEHWQRAFDAQRELARSDRHRGVGIADQLTAVLAAEHPLTLIHYDADFEIAAEVLAFDHRGIAPRGTI